MYRWKYHCVRSRSVGMGSATIRATRGLRYSVTRLIVLPLPAASRPSKTTTTRWPVVLTHSWTRDELGLQPQQLRLVGGRGDSRTGFRARGLASAGLPWLASRQDAVGLVRRASCMVSWPTP